MATNQNAKKPGAPKPPWPVWKKAALAVASVLLLSGGGIQAYAFARSGKAPMVRQSKAAAPQGGVARASSAGPLAAGLVSGGIRTEATSQGAQVTPPAGGEEEGKAGAAEAEPSNAEKVSPILIESGLSFFVGFCIAWVLRAVAKIVVIGLGLAFLCIFGLQYAGIVGPINWASFEGPFRTGASAVGRWAGHIQSYVAHALPSGAMAGLGLAAGFKK